MRLRRILALLVAGQLAASDVEAAPYARAALLAPEPAKANAIVRAELQIDAKLGEASPILAERVRVRGEALLRRREVLPARDENDPRIFILIEPLGDTPGYRCHFAATRQGVAVEGSEFASECPMCTESDLLDHIDAAIERVVPRVPVVAPEPVGPPPTDTPPPTEKQRKPLSAIGKAGIGVSSVGLAATIAGAVLVTRPAQRGDGLEGESTNLRRPGFAVLAVGCGLLIGGLAMLAVDRHRARRKAK